MKYYLLDFSMYDNYTVKSECKNISNVMDKLLRLTTKITERYAGDVLLFAETFNKAVDSKSEFRRLVAFRESGVDWYPVDLDAEGRLLVDRGGGEMHGSQFWYLSHIPGDDNVCETILRRVTLESDQMFPQYLGGES